MKTQLRSHRKAWGVSLDEASAALTKFGPGFSRARLSIAERGLITLSESERQLILKTVERLGILRSQFRRIVDKAERLDLIGLESEVRHLRECVEGVGEVDPVAPRRYLATCSPPPK
jgi:hypothetical protein